MREEQEEEEEAARRRREAEEKLILSCEPELEAVEDAHLCAVCLDVLYEPHATK